MLLTDYRESKASESDIEDAGDSTITLPDKYIGKGNQKSEERAIRLSELGPRLTLSLIKIQENLNEGDVLYQIFPKKVVEATSPPPEKKRK
jgi:ribosome biogenesis protein SSF1/2